VWRRKVLLSPTPPGVVAPFCKFMNAKQFRWVDMTVRKIGKGEVMPYSLLLLADPEKQAIDKYIFDAEVYLAEWEGKRIGVYVLLPLNDQDIELKNIAVDEGFQGMGVGRFLLNQACEKAEARSYARLVIGTGNSSIGELYFYQKQGFEIYDIKKNFFLENYIEPIIENGIQDKHMLMLEKLLLPIGRSGQVGS
jgi:ribosomal protein S18 acetylase RimI-like enzyme